MLSVGKDSFVRNVYPNVTHYEHFQYTRSAHRGNDLCLNLSYVASKSGEEGENKRRIASGHRMVNGLRQQEATETDKRKGNV